MNTLLELTPELVAAFACASGDHSSIHTDPQFARLTRYRRPIVHGMLPVLCLLLQATATRQSRRAIKSISCQFQAAASVGDRLHLTWKEAAGDEGECVFAITAAGTGAAITTGRVVFTPAPNRPPPTAAAQDEMLARRLEENALSLAGLKPGLTERISFRAGPGPLRKFRAALDESTLNRNGGFEWQLADPSVLALLPVSALVGMRLPGRFATFTEFEAVFQSWPEAGEALWDLEGTVERVTAASQRARLALAWTVGGTPVARGSAALVVGTERPAAITCAAIRNDHLAPGVAGKVALVTGASRGIGEATAKLLAMQGASVIVHYFQGKADAEAIASEIQANGGRALAVGADLRDETEIEALFQRVGSEWGGVDILVNSAVGEFSPRAHHALTAEDFLAEFKVSLFGLHACCQRALPHMRARRWGKIVNFGTVAVDQPVSGQAKYITVKSALVGYTRSLALETAADNIQVNLVIPAMTETTLLASLPPALLNRMAEESAARRLLQPIDVAKTVLFLASDWAGSISGQRIVLNQGEAPFL